MEESTKKSIRKTQELFRAKGASAVVPPLSIQLAEMAIDHELPELIENHCYADALFLTDLMFQHSRKSIYILTGNCGGEFLKTLKTNFKDAIRRIAARDGKVRVIQLNPTDKPKFFPELREEFPDTFEFKFGRAKTDLSHRIICDDKMVRVEAPHGTIDEETDPDTINANVWFRNMPMAKRHSEFFNAVWQRLNAPT